MVLEKVMSNDELYSTKARELCKDFYDQLQNEESDINIVLKYIPPLIYQ